jgi:hypothetical protein
VRQTAVQAVQAPRCTRTVLVQLPMVEEAQEARVEVSREGCAGRAGVAVTRPAENLEAFKADLLAETLSLFVWLCKSWGISLEVVEAMLRLHWQKQRASDVIVARSIALTPAVHDKLRRALLTVPQ